MTGRLPRGGRFLSNKAGVDVQHLPLSYAQHASQKGKTAYRTS